MNSSFLHISRRVRYLWVIISVLVISIVVCILILYRLLQSPDPNEGGIVFMQIFIPLVAIMLGAVLVSLPDRWVKNKIVLLLMFILLLVFGICVYTTPDKSKGLFYNLLGPLNNALSAFFPSRGSYEIKVDCDWYYIFHTLTYFYAGWLGFALFGRQIVHRIAFSFMPFRQKNLIWGYSEGAMELAKDMLRNTEKDQPIFIFDENFAHDAESRSILFNKLSNDSILVINTDFENLSQKPEDFRSYFRRILAFNRYFTGYRHYFITEDQDFNVKYALIILKQLRFRKSSLTKRSHIYVRTELEGIDVFFQEQIKELTQFVEVHILNQSDLTARQFVNKYPVLDLSSRIKPRTEAPWLSIHNDSLHVDGEVNILHHDSLHVDGEVNILLLGLGWTGYELLKKQVCDAQFIGDYSINIVVVDNDYKDLHGRYMYLAKEAAKFGVNICINPLVWYDHQHIICKQWLKSEQCAKEMQLEEKHIHQANSQAFYEWLDYTDPQIGMPNILYFNRIIVTLGADELNVNTALQLTNLRNHYLGSNEVLRPQRMPEKIFAHVRDKERYAFYDRNDQSPITIFGGLKSIYNVQTLVDEQMDVIPKLVNYVYAHYEKPRLTLQELQAALNDGSADAEWANCTIFNQDSSRAVALNLQNIITITGGLEQLKKMVNYPYYLNRLAEMEHKRWNAFHYMRGISTWPFSEVKQLPYGKDKLEAKGKLLLQGTLVRHICLVEYDQLDEATRIVKNLGNEREDFKATDNRIICHFPAFYEILKSMKVGSKNSHS